MLLLLLSTVGAPTPVVSDHPSLWSCLSIRGLGCAKGTIAVAAGCSRSPDPVRFRLSLPLPSPFVRSFALATHASASATPLQRCSRRAMLRACQAYLVEPSLDAALPVLVEVAIRDNVVVLDHLGSTARAEHSDKDFVYKPLCLSLLRGHHADHQRARIHTHPPSRKVSPKVGVNLELGRQRARGGSRTRIGGSPTPRRTSPLLDKVSVCP